MNSEWPERPFTEAIDFQEGPGIMARDFRESGVPLIRLAGLTGKSLLEGCNYLDPEKVAKKWAHFGLRRGDTLLSSSASLGRIARVGQEAEGAVAYTGLIRMRPQAETILPDYIQYVLRGPHFQRQIEAMGAGSVMRHFGPMHLKTMTLQLPPPDEQRRISGVLGVLDRKRAVLLRLASGLSELLALQHAQLTRTGATERPLGELVSELRRGIGPKYSETGDVLVINQRCVRDGRVFFENARRHDATKKAVGGRHVKVGDVLINSTGVGTLGRVALLRRLTEPATVVDSHVTVVRANPDEVTPACLAQEVLARQGEIEGLGEGTTGQTELSRARLQNFMVAVPERSVQDSFAQLAGPVNGQIAAFEVQAERLLAIRDALLPGLTSGRRRVSAKIDSMLAGTAPGEEAASAERAEEDDRAVAA
jgi:type I restriction enzyme, S subunit